MSEVDEQLESIKLQLGFITSVAQELAARKALKQLKAIWHSMDVTEDEVIAIASEVLGGTSS